MSKRKKPIRLPTDREISLILSRTSPRDQLIVVLGEKLGLRASEIANLRISDIDWHNKRVSFVGKGSKPATLPLTDEVIGYLERALKVRPTNLKSDFLIYNTRNTKKGISRFAVYYLIRKHGSSVGIKLWPHLLRHKFGTAIIKKGDIYRAKEALRHERISTTADIYAHIDVEDQRQDFELLDSRPWLIRVLSKFKPPIPGFLLERPAPAFTGDTIGRKEEQKRLNENLRAKIPTVLVGERGAGSSHLLRQIRGEGVYHLDEIKPARERLIELCHQLKADEVFPEIPKGKSTSAILTALIEGVKDMHYTLVIDSISDVEKSSIALLRKLKEHFTIITSVEIKHRGKAKDVFFGSHEVIEIKNLDSEDAYKLADIASIDLATTPEGREIFLKRVVSESRGNPQALMQIIEKERKRGRVVDASTEISHEAIQEPLSASLFISSFLAIAVAARYGASTVGLPDWKIILIIAIIILALLLLIDKLLKQESR